MALVPQSNAAFQHIRDLRNSWVAR